MASGKRANPKSHKSRQDFRNKLATLPSNAQVSKRPLLRPPIASPYSNADSPKVVYISTGTPFLSAVKRVEKLLRLADKRLVQSATTLAKGKPYRGKRANITTGVRAEDEIGNIARTVEQLKDRRNSEKICVKGTGRAIPKVMEIGLWFQQREEYVITLHTGTVSGIDDVEYEREAVVADENNDNDGERIEDDTTTGCRDHSRVIKHEETKTSETTLAVTETRIRRMNVLELQVSLR